MDANHKITLPRGIRKALDIKSDEKLQLTIAGMNKTKKLIITRERRR